MPATATRSYRGRPVPAPGAWNSAPFASCSAATNAKGGRALARTVPATAAMENLFFALRPDAAAAQRAHALALRLRAEYGLTAQPLPLERLHMTLCFLGSYTSLPDGLQLLIRSLVGRGQHEVLARYPLLRA